MSTKAILFRIFLVSTLFLCFTIMGGAQSSPDTTWAHYGSDAGGTRYSFAQQINRTNVGQLKLAWTFRTGALQPETKLTRKAAYGE